MVQLLSRLALKKIHNQYFVFGKLLVLDYINKLGWANISFDRSIKTIQGKIVGEIVVRM